MLHVTIKDPETDETYNEYQRTTKIDIEDGSVTIYVIGSEDPVSYSSSEYDISVCDSML